MLRPLAGLTIIEFEGIGPGPLAGRMLADHGAEVIVDRQAQQGGDRQSRLCRRRRPVAARQAHRRARPQAPGSGRGGAEADRASRRADRGQPARRHGAARPRPRRMRGAQSEARLWPHDRLGAGGAARPGRRARSELRGPDRRAVADGASRRGADRPADRARRRRRRARARLRHRERGPLGEGDGQGLRRRRGDPRHGRGLERHCALGARDRNARRRAAEHLSRLAVLRRLPLRR